MSVTTVSGESLDDEHNDGRADDPDGVRRLSPKAFIIQAGLGIVPVAVFLLLPMGTWASISELPMHPLIVHGVVVAIPVLAIAVMVSAWRPGLLGRIHTVLWFLAVLTTLGVIAAASSGNSLAAAVGLPETHAQAGNRLVQLSIGVTAATLAVIFFTLVRPMNRIAVGVRGLAALAALAMLPLGYVAGHSGAEAVWEEQYAIAQEPIAVGNLSLSMQEVARHASAQDCWTVVDGVVYDVTSFVARHPAGAESIREMCGQDATEDFMGEHAGQGEPEKWLATLRIGTVD